MKWFLNLLIQSVIIKFLAEHHPDKSLIYWQNVTFRLSDNTVRFNRRYLIYSLSNGRQLQKLRQRDSPNCLKSCNKKEAQLAIFRNYEAALNNYVWRHNLTLKTVMNNMLI